MPKMIMNENPDEFGLKFDGKGMHTRFHRKFIKILSVFPFTNPKMTRKQVVKVCLLHG